MKKVVEIIGIEKREGISKKTNEPYKFYILHGIYDAGDRAGVQGTCTWSGVVPSAYAERTKLQDSVVIESHFINGREIIDSFLLPDWQ